MCGCDDVPAQVYRRETRRSRKEHRCLECGATIPAGTPHEVATGLWDGEWDSFRTCERCVALRDHVRRTVPDACLMHGNMLDDCRTAMEEAHDLPPGARFGYARRLHAVETHNLLHATTAYNPVKSRARD
jgi:hypothetical protein